MAERRAEIARFMVARRDHMTWGELVAAVAEAFPDARASKATLRRILAEVEGVDPINFAPALLPGYQGKVAKAPVCDEAWTFFLTILRDAAPEFPLISAWRDVRDVAKRKGWRWPSYPTVLRRWNALDPAQRLAVRVGREAAVATLSMPIVRDKTSILPLEWVSLDGRTLDFWVDFGDRKPVRPVMIALVDVASNFVLGYELARSENAVSTARVIRQTYQRFGIFNRLYTDNGSAFAGHLVAGGNVHKWRGKGRDRAKVKPLGVCYHLGIDLTFALPKNAQAKIAERTFATLSRVIDDRPEFNGAHAGHAPGASPDGNISPVPVDLALAVIRREIDRHNRETGRRSQGARGRSYEAVFQAGLASRVVRKPSKTQLYYAGLIYTPATVDRYGRVKIDTWTYGGSSTQAKLLPWHGRGAVLVGRDPDDFGAPAVAYDEEGRLICTGIASVQPGVYDSVEGKREAAKNRKAARAAVALGEAASDYLADADLAAALAALDAPEGEPISPDQKIIGARFGSFLKPTRAARAPAGKVPEEYLRNMDTALAETRARGGKLA